MLGWLMFIDTRTRCDALGVRWTPLGATLLRRRRGEREPACSRLPNVEVRPRGTWRGSALRASEDPALLRAPLAACARRAKAQALKAGDRWRECAAFCDATVAAIGTPLAEGLDMAARAAASRAREVPIRRADRRTRTRSPRRRGSGRCGATRRPTRPATRRAVAPRALKAVATASTEGAPRGARRGATRLLNRLAFSLD